MNFHNFGSHGTSVLFVCLGNICRSPLAEGVFRHLVDEAGLGGHFDIDSAGTGAWHVGEPPDGRMTMVAEQHGISLDSRARQVEAEDLDRFDLILAMDRSNLRELQRMVDLSGADVRVQLLREYDPAGDGDEVPDPYYGGATGFEHVYTMVHRSCEALLEDVRSSIQLG
ncbi:MAG: low molecular weight protein-tyrosine-phosphatase [Planctomycetota bacterium]|jgi:protein-tyrosine phosphatase